ncbi:hypothetical protein GOV05_02840 [Candidatus Woesearchaeota archaeon]|nr:hypothetical protein [Candidatus Woesearchaeota archaeon]
MEVLERLRKYGKPSATEIKHYLITSLVLGFIIGFNDRSEEFIWSAYLTNMLAAILIVAFSLFISNLVIRLLTLKMGYEAEYRFSINGLLIGAMLAFASNGYFWYLAPGFATIHLNEALRLGKFRYGLRMRDWARGAAGGATIFVLLALIAHVSAPGNPFVDLFVKINIALAFYSLIPVPENNGINIFFGQRSLFAYLLFAFIAAYAMIKLTISFWGTLFFAFFFGFVGIIFWSTKIDK